MIAMLKMSLVLALGAAYVCGNVVYAKAPSTAVSEKAASVSENQKENVRAEQMLAPTKALVVSDLATALAAAYVNNSTLQQLRTEVMSFHHKSTQAKAEFLPKISTKIGMSGYNAHSASSTRQSGRQAGVTMDLNLFAGGATVASVLSVDQNIRARWANLMSEEQKIFINVINGYLDLISKIQKVEVQKAAHTAYLKNFETSSEKHKIGEETITQVANAESKLAKAEADLRSAEADIVGAKALFVSLTGAEPVNLAKLDGPQKLPVNSEMAVNLAIENHPAIVKAQFEHLASKADLDEANAKLYAPRVNLSASSSRDENSTRSKSQDVFGRSYDSRSSDYRTNNQIGINATFDLYAGGAYSSKKREMHEVAVSKRITINTVKDELTANVRKIWESLQASRENIANFKKQVKAAEIALTATRQEMDVGTKILFDVLQTQAQLVEAQLSLIEAEKMYYQNAYQMVSLLGGLHAKALKLTVEYFDPKAHYDSVPVGY